MGMFDYVNYECECPECGGKVSGFQSKDGECLMDTLETKDVSNFYSSCDECGGWIEFERIPSVNFRMTVTEKEDGERKVIHDHTKELRLE